MSTIGKDISPGRARALQLSGSNLEPDMQYPAPDGLPAGPRAAEDLAAKAVPPLSHDTPGPRAARRSPVKRK
jgi:hypothetical protein